jgi:YD repeat-containing protein
MKKNTLIILAFLFLLALIACQKEIDWSTGGGGITEKLIKIKSQTGADTAQVDYTYDASGRLIREKTTGVMGATNLDNDLIINRNSAGIIITTVQKAAALVLLGVDSIVTRFNYNTGTSKYTSAVFNLPVPGFPVTDSAVYTYDASGRITADEHYLQVGGLPIPLPPVLALKNTYTYTADGKNLVHVAQDAATAPGGPLSPATAQAFTYDTRINPLIILQEAVLLNRTGLYSANNTTKVAVTNTIDPSQNFTMDYTFKYSSNNKPDSSYGTRTPGGAITATKYFYQ